MPRALVVTHTDHEGPDLFGRWLPAAGLDLHVVAAYAGEPLPAQAGYDALVVLGGPMGAGDDDRAPWLPAVRTRLAEAVEAGTPVLGICLGAQLLAAATGGRVEVGAAGPELGVCPVTVQADGDPLLGGLPAVVPAVQWHWDAVVALPPGAQLLAGSPTYPHQAFRLGARAWGVQFHPEASAGTVADWARADADTLRAQGRTPEQAAAGAAAPALAATWQPVAERFAALVAG